MNSNKKYYKQICQARLCGDVLEVVRNHICLEQRLLQMIQ